MSSTLEEAQDPPTTIISDLRSLHAFSLPFQDQQYLDCFAILVQILVSQLQSESDRIMEISVDELHLYCYLPWAWAQ